MGLFRVIEALSFYNYPLPLIFRKGPVHYLRLAGYLGEHFSGGISEEPLVIGP